MKVRLYYHFSSLTLFFICLIYVYFMLKIFHKIIFLLLFYYQNSYFNLLINHYQHSLSFYLTSIQNYLPHLLRNFFMFFCLFIQKLIMILPHKSIKIFFLIDLYLKCDNYPYFHSFFKKYLNFKNCFQNSKILYYSHLLLLILYYQHLFFNQTL